LLHEICDPILKIRGGIFFIVAACYSFNKILKIFGFLMIFFGAIFQEFDFILDQFSDQVHKTFEKLKII